MAKVGELKAWPTVGGEKGKKRTKARASGFDRLRWGLAVVASIGTSASQAEGRPVLPLAENPPLPPTGNCGQRIEGLSSER